MPLFLKPSFQSNLSLITNSNIFDASLCSFLEFLTNSTFYENTDEPESLPEERALYAEDAMDDGSPICLKVSIDPATGDAHFDFTGTGPMVYGNCNAPPAVSYSAIMYQNI